jgi:hypothetical protein
MARKKIKKQVGGVIPRAGGNLAGAARPLGGVGAARPLGGVGAARPLGGVGAASPLGGGALPGARMVKKGGKIKAKKGGKIKAKKGGKVKK